MITHKGRVVYDRKPHLFTEKDIARITKQATDGMTMKQLAKYLWGIDVEVVHLQVISDDDILEFAKEFLALVFAWAKNIGTWLWDLMMSWLGLIHPDDITTSQPDEPETGEQNGEG